MRAAIFREAGKLLTIDTVADPTPGSDQIVIAVSSAGICGSDLHMTEKAGFCAPGTILGHEYAGTVVALGSEARGVWKEGDRVTALPLFSCRSCDACRADLPALCSTGNFAGTTLATPGAYAQFVVARADMAQRLPDGVSDAEGAMVEPLAVGHHIVGRAQLRPQDRVLIMGGGPIGAAVALFARMAGAKQVVVSEPAAIRRERCALLGATATIDPLTENLGERFTALTGGAPDVVFECAGLPNLLHQAISLAGIRGRVIVGGVLFEEDHLSPVLALGKEVSILYSQAYNERDFEAVISALASSKIDARPMHTATISLDELPTTFEALRSDPTQCKVLITPNS